MFSIMKLYPFVTRLWSVVFLLSGIAFATILVIPDYFRQLSTMTEEIVGFRNPIGEGAFWYAQTLAWVAIITFCSDRCSRNPEDKGVFYALVTGKSVTTIVFLVVALTEDPRWFAGVLVDGFIVFSIVLSRVMYLNQISKTSESR